MKHERFIVLTVFWFSKKYFKSGYHAFTMTQHEAATDGIKMHAWNHYSTVQQVK